ncbi:hypothetical protein [Actinoplanes sp. NPDC049316]|uniref:hypothetical protein n=1 Tax=Actinoplanes sp. NPDC049316 TaxID=3154727 RepID=UPI00343A13F8
MWSEVWREIKDLDLGTVPAWFGGLSLFLAFRIFLGDRTKASREQVDKVGVWMEVDWDRAIPGSPTAPTLIRFSISIKNGSDLPVDVIQVAYELSTTWMRPGTGGVFTPVDGTRKFKGSIGATRVPPGETWSNARQDPQVDVGQLSPDQGSTLDPEVGVNYRIRWYLVSDNAGQRWVVEPGYPITPLKWHSRRLIEYPDSWKYR